MGELGIIGPDERVELLDGELIRMPPISPDDDYTVRRCNVFFVQRFADRASISIQGPVTLDDRSEPQPDVMLNALPAEQYAKAHPTPEESLLVIEISKSSLAFDRGRKLRAYARRGVREYWIVNLVEEQVEVYREPAGEAYRVQRRAGRGESVACAAFPDEPLAVDEILPPP
jgi:Uma2 family endonuclease